jgi:hypothetical protein
MLATLTVTGRHMMFRLTAEEDDNRGALPPENPPEDDNRGALPPENPPQVR